MRRYLVWCTLSLVLGIMLGTSWWGVKPFFFDPFSLWATVILGLSGVIFLVCKRPLVSFLMLQGIIFVLGIWLVHNAYVNGLKQVELSEEKEVSFTGRVVEEPQSAFNRTHLMVKTETVEGKKRTYLVSLQVYQNGSLPIVIHYGEMISGKATFTPISKLKPLQRENHVSRGVYCIGTITADAISPLGRSLQVFSITDIAYEVRQGVRERLDRYLSGEPLWLIRGFLIGDTASFSEELREEFLRSGLWHLVAASGSQVAFVLLCIWGLFYFFPQAERTKGGISTILLIILLFVAGCQSSMVRATWMAGVFLLAQWINREPDTLSSLAVSVIAMLLFQPFIILDVGFQLSVTAVLSLIFLSGVIEERLVRLPKLLRTALSMTLAVTIGTLPIIAVQFQSITTLSVLSNVLVAPVFSIVFILGFLLCLLAEVTWAAHIITVLCELFLKYVLWVAKFFASFSFAQINIPTPTLLEILIYCIGVVIVYLLCLKKRHKWIILIACLLFALGIEIEWMVNTRPFPNMLVSFIDVGQGDATLVRTPDRKYFLIDAGGSVNSDYDVGERVVLPFLRKKGVTRLDGVIVTHTHIDHAEGMQAVLNKMPVSKLYLPSGEQENGLRESLLRLAERKKVRVYTLQKGDKVTLGKEVEGEVLFPPPHFTSEEENESAIILRLTYGNTQGLFMADASPNMEQSLLSEQLRSDFLKVSHHGSKYSSIDAFLSAVMPTVAVIPVGKNYYGHPDKETLWRLKAHGSKVYRTDQDGNVTLVLDKKRILQAFTEVEK